MDKRELNDFFESLSLDEVRKEKMLNEILKGEKDMKHMKRTLPIALAAILILSFTTLTALAATFNWHERLIEYFQPTQEQMEAMKDNVSSPQVSATDNGVTVNVLQTIADKHDIYALCEIIAPEDVILTKDIDCEFWDLEPILTSEKDSDTYRLDTADYKVLERKKNKMTLLIRQSAANSLTDKQTLRLNLKNLTRTTEKGDPLSQVPGDYTVTQEIVVPFNLKLSWTMSYEDLTKVYHEEQSVMINGKSGYTLKQIEISPISMWIFIEGPDDSSMSAAPVIKMKDGSVISIRKEDRNVNYIFTNYTDPNKEGGKTSIHYTFDHVTDIENIESITVGNAVVEIN